MFSARAVWRLKRFQSTVVDVPTPNDAKRAEVSLKRFWKKVNVERRDNDLLTVTLDSRPLKTPGGNSLLVPRKKHIVASLVAAEWENQKSLLKPHALPMTSLAARAIDGFDSRKQVENELLKYLDTDTICFLESEPPELQKLQSKHWIPLKDWVNKTFGVDIVTFDSVLGGPQSERTKVKLGGILAEMDNWELAAMERATHASKSFIIALALVKKAITVEEACTAARVEVLSQIQRWGEVEDTHDVDFHDMARQLGSVACLLSQT